MSDFHSSDEPSIDPERQRKARSYARSKLRLFLAEIAIAATYSLLFLVVGLASRVQHLVTSFTTNRLLVVGLCFFVFYLGYKLVIFPVSALAGHYLPRLYGLSTQAFSEWLGDWAKALGLGVVITGGGVEIAYYLLEISPKLWWLIMTFIVFGFSVLLTNLAPIFLVPLFFKMTPIEDSALAERLIRLAEKANAKVRGVYRLNFSAKTTAANAALMGLGNTRRIVLADTLLDRYTGDEVESIFAHELGHHVNGDIAKLIAAQATTTFCALYAADYVLRRYVATVGLDSLADVASLPVIAITVGAVGLLLMPLSNWLSRHFESQADRYALQVTQNPRAFRKAMVRLANQNLAELQPSAWVEFVLYDHPPIGKRIAMADAWQSQHQV